MAEPAEPLDLSDDERKRKILWEKGKGVGCTLGGAFIVLVFFIPMIQDALHNLVPSSGTKLSKMPVIGSLFTRPSLEKLDRAFVGAFAIYLCVMYVWRNIILLWMTDDESDGLRYRKFLTFLGVILLLADAVLMYAAITGMSWGSATFSAVGILFTIVYLGVLITISVVSARIKLAIKKLEEK